MEMIGYSKLMMENEYGKMLFWLIFILAIMLVDILTGFIQACVNKNIKSGKMSTGLLKKSAILMVLIIIIPFTILLPDIVSTTIIITVYTLETINEFYSIMENLVNMGVEIKPFKPFIKLLDIYKNDNEEEK